MTCALTVRGLAPFWCQACYVDVYQQFRLICAEGGALTQLFFGAIVETLEEKCVRLRFYHNSVCGAVISRFCKHSFVVDTRFIRQQP